MKTRTTARKASTPRIKRLKLRRILVPVDFSGHSHKALDYAVALAEQNKARITLLHVVQMPVLPAQPVVGGGLGAATFERDVLIEQAHKELTRLGEKMIPPKFTDRTVVRVGVPYNEIVRAVRKLHADLVVVGTHGNSQLARMILGSTAERVVRLAPCPVLTVRDPA